MQKRNRWRCLWAPALVLFISGHAAAQDAADASANAAGDSPTRALPEQVQADVNAIAAQMLEIRPDDVELSCPKAVENARWGVDTMLEVGERNMQGGYLSRTDYEATAAPLRAQLETLTVQDCEASSGGRQAFYRCMTSDYNHVLACAKLDR